MVVNITSKTIQGILVPDTWKTLGSCDVLLVRHDNDCGYIFNGKAYAQLIDSFGDLCQSKGLHIQSVATPFSVLSGSRAYYSPVTYNQTYKITEFLQNFIRIMKGKKTGKDWSNSRLETLWMNIFAKARPKVVIGIQPYVYICRAAKKMNIPIYDLQHGVINNDNVWYGEKYRDSTPPEDLPDGFLCWDEQSVATIEKWGKKKGLNVLNVGNPWFSRFITIEPEDRLVHEALGHRTLPGGDLPRILVSLQWDMRDYYQEKTFNGVIIDALEKAILDTSEIYHWTLRLHPVQLRGEERERTLKYLTDTFGGEKSQEWLQMSQLPLPVVLQQTDLHITDLSTVVIEAAWMGVRSALLNPLICKGGKWETLFAHERSQGMAEVLPHDADIIRQWIESTLLKGRAEPMMRDSSLVLDAFIGNVVQKCKS